jgi:hypothetical protein
MSGILDLFAFAGPLCCFIQALDTPQQTKVHHWKCYCICDIAESYITVFTPRTNETIDSLAERFSSPSGAPRDERSKQARDEKKKDEEEEEEEGKTRNSHRLPPCSVLRVDVGVERMLAIESRRSLQCHGGRARRRRG